MATTCPESAAAIPVAAARKQGSVTHAHYLEGAEYLQKCDVSSGDEEGHSHYCELAEKILPLFNQVSQLQEAEFCRYNAWPFVFAPLNFFWISSGLCSPVSLVPGSLVVDSVVTPLFWGPASLLCKASSAKGDFQTAECFLSYLHICPGATAGSWRLSRQYVLQGHCYRPTLSHLWFSAWGAVVETCSTALCNYVCAECDSDASPFTAPSAVSDK